MNKNKKLQERRIHSVAQGVASATSIYIEKADNALVWDVEGNRYIDLAAGIAVMNTGHANEKVTKAVNEQIQRFSHTAFQVAAYESYIELAEKLNQRAPIENAKSLLLTTGAEAVENAIKIARHYTKRSGIIAFHGGFHGRTNLTMGLTGKVMPYKSGFGPFSPDIYHVPFPIDFYGISVKSSLDAIAKIFKTDIDPSQVAAIILEPVQGEGGFYPAPDELMRELRDLCDKHGILLIFDEVQTGFARTGKLFASEHYDVAPDLMTTAKALAGGFPLSGVIGRGEIMDSPHLGGLGGTYGGSPVGCAAALAVIDEIESKDLCQRSYLLGERLKCRLESIKQENSQIPIDNIRGLGMMFAFDFVDNELKQPLTELPSKFTKACLDKGVILLSCGQFGNTIRVLAPLTIEEEILDEALDIIESSLKEMSM